MPDVRSKRGFDYLSSGEQAAAHSYKGFVQKPLVNDGLQGKSQFSGQEPTPHINPHKAASFGKKRKKQPRGY